MAVALQHRAGVLTRRLARWTLFAIAGMLLLGATSALVVETAWFKERLRRIVVERANEALNAQLSVGRLAGSLWTGVELHDVRLVQTAGPVLAARRISLRYDPRILLRGHLTFIELAIHEPVIHVTERANGWNVATLAKPRDGGRSTRIEFQKIAIADGDVRVAPANADARHLDQLQASLELSYTAERLELNVGGLQFRDADTGLVVRSATGEMSNTRAGLAASFNVDSSAGAFSGTVERRGGVEDRVIQARTSLTHVDLAALVDRPDLRTDITGLVNIQTGRGAAGAGSSPSAIAFQVDAPAVTALGYSAQQVRGEGSYAGGVLRFDVAGAAYGARTTAKGVWRGRASDENALTVSGHVGGLDLRRLPRRIEAPRLASRIAGRYEFAYGPRAWSASMRFDNSDVEGARISAGAVAHAVMRGRTPTYDFQGRVARLDLHRLAGPLGIATLREGRFKSLINGVLDVRGRGRTLDGTTLRAEAVLEDSTIGPAYVPAATVAADLASRRLTVDFSGSFEHVTQLLVGTPNVPLDLTGRAETARLVFYDMRAPFGVDTIDAEGRVTLERSMLHGYDVDRAEVDASLSGGTATVRALTVEGPQIRATASGVLAIKGEASSDLAFSVDADTLETPAKLSGRPIEGAGHVEGRIAGPPEQLTATGTFELHQFKYGTSFSAMALNGVFGAEVANQQWRDAALTTDATAAFVKIAGTDIDQVTAKAAYRGKQLDLDTRLDLKQRSLELAGTVAFDPDDDEVRLRRLALSAANQQWTLPPGREAVVRYGRNRVAIEGLALTRDAQLVEIAGTLGIGDRRLAAAGIDVTLQNVQIADVNTLLGGTRALSGVVNGTARVEGNTDAPTVVSKVTVTGGMVEQTPFQSLIADATLRGGEVSLDAVLDVQPGARLTAAGTFPGPAVKGDERAFGDRPLDLRVNTDAISLGIFQALTAEVTDLTGTGQFDVHVTGTPKAPRVSGSVAVDNASFMVAATGLAYSAGTARLRFDGDHVIVDQLSLVDDDGHTLTARGGADVANGRNVEAVDLQIAADHLHLLRNDFGDIEADATLKVSGPLRALNIDGDVRFSRARLDVDRILERFTTSAYAEEAAPLPEVERALHEAGLPHTHETEPPPPDVAGAVAGSFLDNAAINVRLNIPDDLVLRARDLRVSDGPRLGSTNVTVGGTLSVEKPRGGDLAMVGLITVVRGYYDFQGRRFDIERGSAVQFRGDTPINPGLNVTGTRDISGVLTQVGVRGTARQPTIQLSSVPPLDQSDILSLIVFGQPVNALGESQRLNLAQRAGSLALGAVAGPVAESVGRALNLDLFEIRAEGEGGAPEIALGSQVGSRVFIGLRQELGREELSAVTFEYRISQLLRLVTSVAQGAQSPSTIRRADPTGVDLIFVYRY